MTTNQEPAAITADEQEIIRTVCQKWGWIDIDFEECEGLATVCNLGPFSIEKWSALEETETIAGIRTRPVSEWLLLETVFCSGYPSEPDYTDIVDFDTVQGSIWVVLETLRLREKSWEIRNELDSIGMEFAFRKRPEEGY